MKLKKWLLPVVITLMAILIVWLAVSNDSPVRTQNAREDAMLWSTGWQVETGDGLSRAFETPVRLSPGEHIIFKTLPVALAENNYLYIKTDYQQVSASVDGVPASVLGVSTLPGNTLTCDLPWCAVRLTPDMAGKTLRLNMNNMGSKPFVEIYSVRLGAMSEIRLALLSSATLPILLSLLIVLFSLAMFSFAVLEARRYREKLPLSYFYLLVFVLVSGTWFYIDTDIAGVNYLGSQSFLLTNLFSFMLLPIPFLWFVCSMQPSLKRIGFVFSGLYIANAVLQAVLIITGHFTMWIALISSHTLTIIVIAVLLYPLCLQKRCHRKINGELALGIMITAIAGILTALIFYLFPNEDNASAFRYGVMVMVITMTISVLRSDVDILMQARNFEELRIHEEEYRIAVRQSDKYVVRYDVAAHTLILGEEPTPLFGENRVISDIHDAAIASGVVPEESVADLQAFYHDILAGKPSGSCAVRLRNQDGRLAWYHADYTTIFGGDHQPVQAIISFYDITAQREKELAYQKWKQLYTEMPSTGMNYYEYNLTRDTFSGEAGHMLPVLPADIKRSIGLMVGYLAEHQVAPVDDAPFRAFFDRARLLEAFSHGIRSDKLEFRRLDAQSRPLWTLASVQLISDPYSNDVQSFLLLQDEDEAKRDDLQVRARSNSDPLTGLLNRTAFEERLNDLLSQGDPDGVHALIMIDLDGFKRVNDTYGHQFGDRVLIDISNSLRAMMRGDDLIGRIGGDEYMVCLKNVKDDTGFLERRSAFICRSLNRQFGSDVAISGSVGLALFPRDGRTFDILYQKADKALYYAKHHGKNRYVFYHDELLTGDVNAPSTHSAYCTPADADTVAAEEREPIRTLLIVDDVEMNRDLLCEIFRDEYQLLTAESGQQCLKMMERTETGISALLLDLIMPGMNGLEVLKHIRSDAYMSSIPVIVTSSADETEYSLKAIELGAVDFINKPIDPELVRLRVKIAIHKRETEELRAQNRYLLVQKSEESRHQNELRYMAEHDALTGICNKAAFYKKTRTMIDKAPDTTFVMIAFDIEKFRVINDIFGHEQGDRLLRYIAQRLQTIYASQATYSRIDADNFTLCLPYDSAQLRTRLAENEAELKDYDLPFEILMVYGLYIVDDRTLPISIMHDRAELAKRTVKGNYLNRFAYYDEKLRKELLDELEIVNNMNGALQSGQFEIYLQPKCLLSTGEIEGAEALVRWNHPTRGILKPSAFVPIFEKNGFIMKLDAFVWERVCILLRKWMDGHADKQPLPVSMNVSRVNIYNPALVSTLCNLADKYGVPRRMLELEITESAYAQDPKQLSDLIAELHNRGFTVEMDDFGSAYSSLNMLKEITVDLLKLDMRFLFGNDKDGRGGTILSSIVRMARYLSLPIVAEGVETAEQARFLCSIGCIHGQGFYYYEPMPVAAFERLLATHPLRTVSDLSEAFPEATVRRVWSIDGDFSLMLSTIPCAATLCEMSADKIEVLRINDEYLAMTGDSPERIYNYGTDVSTLTTQDNYSELLALFHSALESQGIAEGHYQRANEKGVYMNYHVKIRYLSGDAVRCLFFITYQPQPEGSANA